MKMIRYFRNKSIVGTVVDIFDQIVGCFRVLRNKSNDIIPILDFIKSSPPWVPATRTRSGKLKSLKLPVRCRIREDGAGDANRLRDNAIRNIGETPRNGLPVSVHDQTRMVDRRPIQTLYELERLRQDVLAIIRIANHVEDNVRLAAKQIQIDRCPRYHTVEMTIVGGSASQIIDRGRAGKRRIKKHRRKVSFLLIGTPGDEWL